MRSSTMLHLILALVFLAGCSSETFGSGFNGHQDSGVEIDAELGQGDGGGGFAGSSSAGSGAVETDSGAGGTGGTGGTAGTTAAGGSTLDVDGGAAGSSAGGTSTGDDAGHPSSGGSAGSVGAGGTGGASGCEAGAVQCVGAQRQTCIGGIWLDNGAACDGWCLEGACTECQPGVRSCASDAQPQTCSASGSWVPGTECSGATPLCSEGTCATVCCQSSTTAVPCDTAAPWWCTGGQTFSCTDLGDCHVGSVCYSGPSNLYGNIIPCP